MSSRRPGRRPGPDVVCLLRGPARLRRYPLFLHILTDAGPTALAHRIDGLRAIAGEHPAVAALARDVPLGAAVHEDLEAHAVHTPVWHALTTDTTPRTWTQL
ncbi:hypothetical protein ACFVY1_25810 [Streptomyces sp. NPDC058293]|uniref:hypothetical protein n=1 Tax=Streptomyces sp. NPDC058293 TaxID=3346429 RepID=UPI0036EF4CA3